MEVIYNIGKMFAAEMQLCVDLGSISKCHDLYDKVKDMPSTRTRGIIQKESSIILNGPLSTDFPNILLGVDIVARKRIVVKLIKGSQVPRPMSQQQREETKNAEVEACRVFTMLNVDGLVKCDVVQVNIQSVEQLEVGCGIWQAIKMHDYGTSLAKLPQLPEHFIAEGFHRILNAIGCVHSEGYVHMDIKSANVFVTHDLFWDLGDFGSVRRHGEQVLSWTPQFTPYEMPLSCNVVREMDIVQLCVMIAVELTKENWGKQLCGEGSSVQEGLVLEVLLSIKSQVFQDEIARLFRESMTVVKNHMSGNTLKQS